MKKIGLYFLIFVIFFCISYAGKRYYLNSIPKIIHYVWLGKNPLPDDVIQSIESWKKYAPDYKIMRWDETNCPIESSPYATQTYADKKYAFTSDFCRYYALYHQGGLYLDTDHVLTRPLDSFFVRNVPLVITYEHNSSISASFVGMQKHHEIAQKVLDYFSVSYKTTQTSPEIMTRILSKLYPTILFDGKFFKNNQIIVYPANETMFNFGGPENFALHRYDGSSTNLQKGSYYRLYFKTFLNEQAVAIKNNTQADYLIPIRKNGVYLFSSKKMGIIKNETNTHITVLFNDKSIQEFEKVLKQ